METFNILIHNAETGKILEREATAKERAQKDIDAADEIARLTQAETKAQAKTAAQAKLAALGLTVDDLQALGL
jgi:flagellin-like hook-associated protein FlgL